MNQSLTGILFVTGTDTDVGKTVATAVLAASGRLSGHQVICIKPCQTGLAPGEAGDVQHSTRLAGLTPADAREYVRLPEPLAPTTAARRAGMAVTPGAALAARIVADARELTLVEGAGGILVGLDNAGATLLDLAAAMPAGTQPAFVVVARPGLGTLNHTALTCAAIRDRGFEVAGIVVGTWPAEPGLAERCNLAELADAGGAPVWAVLAEGLGDDPAGVEAAARHLLAVLAG